MQENTHFAHNMLIGSIPLSFRPKFIHYLCTIRCAIPRDSHPDWLSSVVFAISIEMAGAHMGSSLSLLFVSISNCKLDFHRLTYSERFRLRIMCAHCNPILYKPCNLLIHNWYESILTECRANMRTLCLCGRIKNPLDRIERHRQKHRWQLLLGAMSMRIPVNYSQRNIAMPSLICCTAYKVQIGQCKCHGISCIFN